jgi:hypothetical protein
MKLHGSLVVVALTTLALGLGGSEGCKKEEAPKPEPTPPAELSSAHAAARHNPRGPGIRTDPQALKDYRLDYCYYGTFSLRQARDAYLGSLGKDEPSAKKLPSFGMLGTNPPAQAGTAAATSPGKAPPKPGAAGATSAGAAPGASAPRELRMDAGLRLPHERNARSCTSAIGLKDPPMGDVDAQIATFGPFVVELAKDITAAQQYYQREDYTKDAFARGKELDKKLREEFAKLDDLSDKLGAALAAWRKDHPPDLSKVDEGEKMSRTMLDDARDVFLLVMTKKADGDAWKSALAKLDKSVDALKSFAEAHANDSWAKIMSGSVEAFVKTIKGTKVTPDKTFDLESYLNLVTNFTSLLEGRQRAASRMAMSRPMLPPQTLTGAPDQPAPPPPEKPAQPQ